MADRNVKIVNYNGLKSVTKSLPKTASTAFDKNSLVEFASGVIDPVDDNDVVVYGIIREEVASTDSDYAATSEKLVDLIMPGVEVEITTSAAATPGVSYGLSNAYTVDVSDTTNDVFTCTKAISSTKARGFFKTYAAIV